MCYDNAAQATPAYSGPHGSIGVASPVTPGSTVERLARENDQMRAQIKGMGDALQQMQRELANAKQETHVAREFAKQLLNANQIHPW